MRSRFKITIPLFIFILIYNSLPAQQRIVNPQVYNTSNGLPNAEIRCILKDSKGYLWFGTLYGLVKYDGSVFHIYNHQSQGNAISGDVITTIFENNNNEIMVGANGLSILDRKTNQWTNYRHKPGDKNSISSNTISSIAAENDSIYWIITNNGINRFNRSSQTFTKLHFDPNLRSFYSGIINMVPRKSISYFISSVFYRYNFATDTFQLIPTKNQYDYNGVTIFNNAIVGIQHVNNKTVVTATDLISQNENVLSELQKGNSVVFHDNNNLFVVNNRDVYIYNSRLEQTDAITLYTSTFNENSGIEVLCGIKEENGLIWLGTNNGLLKIQPPGPFQLINSNNGLSNPYIRSIAITKNHELLIGVKQGPLYKIDITNQKQLFKTITAEAIQFPANAPDVYATNNILELSNGNWLIINQNSISCYDPANKRFIQHLDKIQAGPFFSAIEMEDGILVGSLNKPVLIKYKFNNNTLEPVIDLTLKDAPESIYTFYKDINGQIWVGGEGLYKLELTNSGQLAVFHSVIPAVNPENLVNNSVWNITGLSDYEIIAGTTTNGIYLLNDSTHSVLHFNKELGLATDFTCATITDKHQNIWVSTKEGISRINTKTNVITNYPLKDGVTGIDFTFKCSAKTRNGLILFGSRQGLLAFNPDSIKPQTGNYPLIINEFLVFDNVKESELENDDTITLNFNQNFFTFRFSMLDYRNPEQLIYSYQLAGYDKTERQSSRYSPSASYTKVPPGKYRFSVTAFNPSENGQHQTAEITVIIKPAFYQTVLFKIYVGAILFILIAGVIIITIRRQILKGKLYKLELDLLRAQINPHFIFNTLTSIQHTILLKSKEIAIEQLSKFARLMRMGLDFSRLDFVPVDKVLQFFQTYVAVESVNLDEEIDFAITVDPQIDQQKMTISPMIIQPFIENAIIHGLAPKQKNMQLKLDINKTGSYLTCQITDNGIGRKAAAEIAQKKAKTHQSMGIKLSTQKIRAQMAKNRIQSEVVSIEDNYDATGHASGTTIRIIIPFKTLEHS